MRTQKFREWADLLIKQLKMSRIVNLGFTLLELLVGLFVLSILFLLLTNSLQLGVAAWSTREEESMSASDSSAVQNLLRTLLSEASPVMTTKKMHRVFFVGMEHSIRFVAPIPRHLGIGGLYEVNLAKDGSGDRIEMYWRLLRDEASSGVTMGERRVTLVPDVSQVRFAYFGRGPKDKSAKWHNEWQDLWYLPELIRMSVSFRESSHIWPDLVAAPVAQTLQPIVTELDSLYTGTSKPFQPLAESGPGSAFP
jgi:general secretion pathway protein J